MSQWDIIEKRLEALDKSIDELKKELDNMKNIYPKLLDMTSTNVDLDSKHRDFISLVISSSMMPKEVALNILEDLFKLDKRLLEEYLPVKEFLITYSINRVNSMLKVVIPQYKIAFDEFAEITIRIFGVQLAKDLIPIENIIQLFGSENAKSWKEF